MIIIYCNALFQFSEVSHTRGYSMKLNKHRVASGKDGHFFANRVITFRVSRRRREMYCGHARLCVCLCVCLCLFAVACLHYCTDPDVTWGVVGDAP